MIKRVFATAVVLRSNAKFVALTQTFIRHTCTCICMLTCQMLVCQIYVSVFVIYVDMYVRCSFAISVCWLSSVDFSVTYVDCQKLIFQFRMLTGQMFICQICMLTGQTLIRQIFHLSDLYVDWSNVNFFRSVCWLVRYPFVSYVCWLVSCWSVNSLDVDGSFGG